MRILDYLDGEELLDLENARLVQLNKKARYIPYACLKPSFSYGEIRTFRLQEDGPEGFFYNDLLGKKYYEATNWPYKKSDFIPITGPGPTEIRDKTFIFGKRDFTVKLSPQSYDNTFTKLFNSCSKVLKLKGRFNWADTLVYATLATRKDLLDLDVSYSVKNKDLYITARGVNPSTLHKIAKQITYLRAEALNEHLFVPEIEQKLSYRTRDPIYDLSYAENLEDVKEDGSKIFFSFTEPKGKPIDKQIEKSFKQLNGLKKKELESIREAYQLIAAHNIVCRDDLDRIRNLPRDFTKYHLLAHKDDKKKQLKAFLAFVLIVGFGVAVTMFWPQISAFVKESLGFI